MNNDIKSQLQAKEFEGLKGNNRVILKWATGCGKSKMTIDLINHILYTQYEGKFPRILFVVAERAHINNWKDEFNKWHLYCESTKDMYVRLICYASLHTVKEEEYDIVVFDEAHHIFTDKRMDHIHRLTENMPLNNYVFLLSATLSKSKVDMAEEMFGKFKISTVSLKDAISNEILPDPRVYIIGMDLDDKNYDQEIINGTGTNLPKVRFEHRAKYIYNNKPCIIQCTQKQKYVYLSSAMEYWKCRYERSHNAYHHNRWVNIGSVRKRYMGELKTDIVRKLIDSFPAGRRFVCFCATVAQANQISKTNTISSKKPMKANQDIIDAFNDKKINQIYAVGMITEGMNLTDIETGIIVQLDGKERLFIQKFGRSMRAEDPVSFIFYYKGTQDENYLNSALENIDDKFVRRIDINQLNKIKL